MIAGEPVPKFHHTPLQSLWMKQKKYMIEWPASHIKCRCICIIGLSERVACRRFTAATTAFHDSWPPGPSPHLTLSHCLHIWYLLWDGCESGATQYIPIKNAGRREKRARCKIFAHMFFIEVFNEKKWGAIHINIRAPWPPYHPIAPSLHRPMQLCPSATLSNCPCQHSICTVTIMLFSSFLWIKKPCEFLAPFTSGNLRQVFQLLSDKCQSVRPSCHLLAQRHMWKPRKNRCIKWKIHLADCRKFAKVNPWLPVRTILTPLGLML